jgi:RNA polymerase sigma-70 factor (ECF subfamily)
LSAIAANRTAEFEAGVLAAMPRLHAYAMSLCRNHHKAEDLVQDTVTRALIKADLYEPGTNLVGWLFTILRNDWYSQCRKRGREVSDPDGIIAGMIAIPEGQSSAHDLKIVRKRMRLLSTDARRAIELVAMNGYQYDEAAEMLGTEVGTIKSRVSRARDFLETGDEANLAAEGAEALRPKCPPAVETMYGAGAAISEIALATGLSRSEVMQAVADGKMRRA